MSLPAATATSSRTRAIAGLADDEIVIYNTGTGAKYLEAWSSATD